MGYPTEEEKKRNTQKIVYMTKFSCGPHTHTTWETTQNHRVNGPAAPELRGKRGNVNFTRRVHRYSIVERSVGEPPNVERGGIEAFSLSLAWALLDPHEIQSKSSRCQQMTTRPRASTGDSY